MTVKIDGSALGINKLIKIEETGKLMKDTLKLQIFLVKPVEAEDEDAYLAYLENSLKTQEVMEEYVINTLGLTEAQSKKVENLSADDLGTLVSDITKGVLHLNVPSEMTEGEDEGKA